MPGHPKTLTPVTQGRSPSRPGLGQLLGRVFIPVRSSCCWKSSDRQGLNFVFSLGAREGGAPSREWNSQRCSCSPSEAWNRSAGAGKAAAASHELPVLGSAGSRHQQSSSCSRCRQSSLYSCFPKEKPSLKAFPPSWDSGELGSFPKSSWSSTGCREDGLLCRDARGEGLVLGMFAEPLNSSSWKVWEDVTGEATMLIQCWQFLTSVLGAVW